MKTLSKFFNRVCTQKYKVFGFVRCSSFYARIKGDIIQTFYLKHSQYVPSCTVTFGIIPLCLPQPHFLSAGAYELDKFVVELHKYSSLWTFDPDSDESMEKCIKSLTNAIDMYLIPFFDRCYDCKSALEELIKLEELFEENRQKILQLIGGSDMAAPWYERSLFDYKKYYMALKSHNLIYAHQYLIHQINSHKRRLEEFDNPNFPEQPDCVRERCLAGLKQNMEQLDWIESGDFGKFDDMLNNNEKQMYEFLSIKHSKILKKGDIGPVSVKTE